MIDLESLKQAMADISSVGHIEHTFEVNGHRYMLCPMSAPEEAEVFEYAETAIEGVPSEEQGQAASIKYMDRFRIATISHSLVMIGEMDLRGIQEIETGERLNNGNPVKILRYQAVRDVVKTWSKPIIEQVFLQFGEMTRRVEEKAQKAVRYEPSDLGAEAERIQERLEWMDLQLQRHENPDPELSKKIREQATSLTKIQARQRAVLAGTGTIADLREAVVENSSLDTPPEEPPMAQAPPVERPRAPEAFTAADRPVPPPRYEDELEPLQPQAMTPPQTQPSAAQPPNDPRFRNPAPPPVARQDRPPAHAPEVSQRPPEPAEMEQRFHRENPDIHPGEDMSRYTATGDSMMGDNEEASLEAEAARQALLRQQRIREMEQQRQEEERLMASRQSPESPPSNVGTPDQVQITPGGVMVAPGQNLPQQGRAPRPHRPHQDAVSTQEAVKQAISSRGSGAQRVEDVEGIPAYKLPRTELSHRTKREAAENRAQKVVVDGHDHGSNNPRFTGRKRQR